MQYKCDNKTSQLSRYQLHGHVCGPVQAARGMCKA